MELLNFQHSGWQYYEACRNTADTQKIPSDPLRPIEDKLANLFSPRDNWLLHCTTSGKFREHMQTSKTYRYKREFHNLHLMSGIELTNHFGLPILKPITECEWERAVPYSARNEKGCDQLGLHFFEDDYKFEIPTWRRLDQTTYALKDRPFLYTPDHSLFVEDLFAINLWAVYRSRMAGALWQRLGFKVIPTASWGNVDSFQFCFDGLPLNSIIAVCGIGVTSSQEALALWKTGIAELERRLKPKFIVIYGEPIELHEISVPVRYLEPYVKAKLKSKSKVKVEIG